MPSEKMWNRKSKMAISNRLYINQMCQGFNPCWGSLAFFNWISQSVVGTGLSVDDFDCRVKSTRSMFSAGISATNAHKIPIISTKFNKTLNNPYQKRNWCPTALNNAKTMSILWCKSLGMVGSNKWKQQGSYGSNRPSSSMKTMVVRDGNSKYCSKVRQFEYDKRRSTN